MKKIFSLIPVIISFFSIIPVFADDGNEIDCEKSLKVQEQHVLDLITLYGKTDVDNVVMGSYTMGRTDTAYCNHHIIVKYEVPDEVNSSEFHKRKDIIFRYFNLNEVGLPQKPPVFMHGRTPILRPLPPEAATKTLGYPPYKCEQRLELEEHFSRWYGGDDAYDMIAASVVFPNNSYPFCDYHVFLMDSKKGEDNQSSEIWFTHIRVDESWYFHIGPNWAPRALKIKGRVIPFSELPQPH